MAQHSRRRSTGVNWVGSARLVGLGRVDRLGFFGVFGGMWDRGEWCVCVVCVYVSACVARMDVVWDVAGGGLGGVLRVVWMMGVNVL